jgi:hypothetical protein
MSSTAMALAAPATLNVCQPKLNFFAAPRPRDTRRPARPVLELPLGPQLRVLQQEVLDRLVELGLEPSSLSISSGTCSHGTKWALAAGNGFEYFASWWRAFFSIC